MSCLKEILANQAAMMEMLTTLLSTKKGTSNRMEPATIAPVDSIAREWVDLGLPSAELEHFVLTARSRSIFARELFRKAFPQSHTLKNFTCYGSKQWNKKALDGVKVELIKRTVLARLPLKDGEQEVAVWKDCYKSIDALLRYKPGATGGKEKGQAPADEGAAEAGSEAGAESENEAEC